MPRATSGLESARGERFLTLVRGSLIGLLAFSYLALTILMLNVLQVASLLIWPLSRQAFYAINEYFAHLWWGSIVLIMEGPGQIKLVFSGDELPLGCNSIVICNHQGMVDIPTLFCLAWRYERLSALKWFVKDALKYVPGPGWGMLFLNNVFVKRDWLKDQKIINRVFERLKSRGRPFWLVSFLEGTRFRPEKVAQSQAYSRSRHLPVLSHVLAPRTKGFAVSLQALADHIDGVYDITLGFPVGRPSLFELFMGKCKEIHYHVRRYPVASIPRDEESLNAWVWQVYQEKDRLMGFFAKQHHFPAS